MRDNLFVHQMQLKQKNTKKKSLLGNDMSKINHPVLSSNEIEMEGYQSDQPATNLE